MYEINAPAYITPDVVAHFDTIKLEQIEKDRVKVSNVKGSPATNSAKVTINCNGGFQNKMTFYVGGLDIEEKVEGFALIDVNEDPSPTLLNTIEIYKRQLHFIKKTIIPIRDFATKIERNQFKLIQQKHIKYFFEIKDICLTLLDNCDKIEARLESNINLFFSIQGHRMNQVMKTLTVVSTIFIPLTFLAGIYGMNFINIPELTWKWGYYGFWVIIILVFIIMLLYFKRKKWF